VHGVSCHLKWLTGVPLSRTGQFGKAATRSHGEIRPRTLPPLNIRQLINAPTRARMDKAMQ